MTRQCFLVMRRRCERHLLPSNAYRAKSVVLPMFLARAPISIPRRCEGRLVTFPELFYYFCLTLIWLHVIAVCQRIQRRQRRCRTWLMVSAIGRASSLSPPGKLPSADAQRSVLTLRIYCWWDDSNPAAHHTQYTNSAAHWKLIDILEYFNKTYRMQFMQCICYWYGLTVWCTFFLSWFRIPFMCFANNAISLVYAFTCCGWPPSNQVHCVLRVFISLGIFWVFSKDFMTSYLLLYLSLYKINLNPLWRGHVCRLAEYLL